ncbi:MAG: hypothetical protein NC421_07915 [Lachnospiraceae bacterium]|nr:hypothetical protein [Lachnospiraceae bacterium]
MMDRRKKLDRSLGAVAALIAVTVPSFIFGVQKNGEKVVLPVSQRAKRIPVKPTIPQEDRNQGDRVFLERADKLYMDERVSSEYQVVVGNVLFRKGGMYMYCDSALFFEGVGSLQAYGNVKMEQGDTLFVYADQLDYDGNTELATFFGNGPDPVRLINRDVELTTYIFNYDMAANLGYYDTQGTISDVENELTSGYGEYSPDTKDAEFRYNVVLQDKKKEDFRITTEVLKYNTETHIANLVSPTVIVTDSATVYTDNGWYDTENELSELYDRSLIVTNRGSTLTGDTIFYDHTKGYGESWGNMILTDSVKSVALDGDYGFYNQANDSAYATGHARVLEYSKADTLYMHGDTVRAYSLYPDSLHPDTTHIITVYPKVRFWRVDVQGLCDSLAMLERDSTLYMHRHPILWNDKRQVFGGVIMAHFNDSTVDWAKLPEFGFVAEHVDGEFYNQISGKEMIARFDSLGHMRQLDVSGNVEIISLPQENDSTYNKIVNTESSFLTAWFDGKQIEKMILWPEVTGTVTPLYLARKSIYYLNNFHWYEALRPKNKDDIFVIPPEMDALLNEPDPSLRRRKVN